MSAAEARDIWEELKAKLRRALGKTRGRAAIQWVRWEAVSVGSEQPSCVP